MRDVDAVVLAGGRAARLGGIDKTALGAPGNTLLDRALRAASGAARRIVVAGPEVRRAVADVLWTTETPRHAGPVAALAAALALPGPAASAVLVLAADLPEVERAVPALLAAVRAEEALDGWVAVDPDGRDQPLLALYRRPALVAALAAVPGGPAEASLRRLLAPLTLVRVPLAAPLVADVDTPADARRAGLAAM
ncbi:MAG TPA: NTP transferase domain-containing protein [Amnibacterium sp.]|nr:NTP transferase domain-containing protein [Amnibacterium sp.]